MKKIIANDEIQELVREITGQGKTIAFTNGCFDLFHAGHLQTFLEAKKIADVLFVGLNSNTSIKAIKGEKRPIIDEKYRAELIAALECVDYVTLFEETSPVKLIAAIEPKYYLKGSDWKGKKLPEEETVLAHGGTIHYVDLIDGLSSTKIIEKVLEVYGGNE